MGPEQVDQFVAFAQPVQARDAVQRIASVVRGRFIYSGGVASTDDLRKLAALRQVNLAGVIVGSALYEEKFTVAEAHDALGLE